LADQPATELGGRSTARVRPGRDVECLAGGRDQDFFPASDDFKARNVDAWVLDLPSGSSYFFPFS
jgi:hypothetical protein